MSDSSLAALIAQRLNWLFTNVCREDGTLYTHQEVEDGTALLGYRVTTTTVSQLRNGRTPNPGILTLRAVAGFFGVEPWFLTQRELGAEALELVKQRAVAADPMSAEIALRVSEIDPASRQALLGMLRRIAHNEVGQRKDAADEEGGEGVTTRG